MTSFVYYQPDNDNVGPSCLRLFVSNKLSFRSASALYDIEFRA